MGVHVPSNHVAPACLVGASLHLSCGGTNTPLPGGVVSVPAASAPSLEEPVSIFPAADQGERLSWLQEVGSSGPGGPWQPWHENGPPWRWGCWDGHLPQRGRHPMPVRACSVCWTGPGRPPLQESHRAWCGACCVYVSGGCTHRPLQVGALAAPGTGTATLEAAGSRPGLRLPVQT